MNPLKNKNIAGVAEYRGHLGTDNETKADLYVVYADSGLPTVIKNYYNIKR